MRRLPHLDDDSNTERNSHFKIQDWPAQRSRRHSEPPFGISSNTTTAVARQQQQQPPSPSSSTHPLATSPTASSWSAIAAQYPEKVVVGIHGASSLSVSAASGHLAVPFPKRGRSRSCKV